MRQLDAARKLKITNQTLSLIENGFHYPKLDLFLRMCILYECDEYHILDATYKCAQKYHEAAKDKKGVNL